MTALQLKQLAEFLTYKADQYDKAGRIYPFQHPFVVEGTVIKHGERIIDLDTLVDGHGRPITFNGRPIKHRWS